MASMKIETETRRCYYKHYDYQDWKQGWFHTWHPNGNAIVETRAGFIELISCDHIKFSDVCDHLNDNKIWVDRDTYYRIMDNPDGVIFETMGERPIMWSGRKVEEDG